jgi:chromosome segregation ATPase
LDGQLTHYQVVSIGPRTVSAEESARKLSGDVSQLEQARRALRGRVDQAESTIALLEEQIIKRNEMIDNLSTELRRSEAQRRKLADLLSTVGTGDQIAEARALGLLESTDPNAQRVDGEQDKRDTEPPTAE